MDYYSQGASAGQMGTGTGPGMTIDKACKLLRAAQPLVWAVAIVLGLLGVTLTVRYLWRKKRVQPEEQQSGSAEGMWMRQ